MKHSEAVKWLRDALWAVQKVRSNNDELAHGDVIMQRVERELFPKIMDENWLLNPLLKIIERIDNGGQVQPQEFYNIMTIIDRWTGNILDITLILNSEDISRTFPTPDIKWLLGWEPE